MCQIKQVLMINAFLDKQESCVVHANLDSAVFLGHLPNAKLEPLILDSHIYIVWCVHSYLLTIPNLTVTEGTISGLIIYANIVYTHEDLFPHGIHIIISKICWIFIA